MMFRSAFVGLLCVASLSLTACMNLPRYTEVQAKYVLPVTPKPESTPVVLLEPVFPGKPFDELVCDNAVGAMSSPEESKVIGFTQQYAQTIAKQSGQLAMLATLPPTLAVGMSASGATGGFNISTRIMVPYGRFIKEDLAALLHDAAPQAEACLTEECVQDHLKRLPASRVVSVHFTSFKVAERKANTLTLLAEGEAKAFVTGQERTLAIQSGVTDRSITSEGYFHSDFLRAMTKMANEVASSLAQQIYTFAAAD
jgi:hypothetical protein